MKNKSMSMSKVIVGDERLLHLLLLLFLITMCVILFFENP